MAVVVIVGIYIFFVGSDDPKNVSGHSLDDVKNLKTAITKDIKQITLSENEKYTIQSVNKSWGNDPFKKIASDKNISSTDKKENEPLIHFEYTAFVSAGNSFVGVINGREYETGDLLKEPGYKLLRIGPSKAVIKGPGKKNTIVIPYFEQKNK